MALLVGNDLDSAMLVSLPDDAFGRVNDTRVHDVAYITGADGFTHAPNAVFRHAIPNAAVANTHELRSRPALLMPRALLDLALTTQPEGRFTILGFYADIIHPWATGAASQQALVAPLVEWFRLMVHDNAAGASVLGVNPNMDPSPRAAQRLQRHRQTVANLYLLKIGVGGPALTSASFDAGVNVIQNAMTTSTNSQLNYFRDRDNKTFTQKHGDALAQRMHNWCGVVADADLPEIHQLLAKSSKNRDYAVIYSQIQARVVSSTVPLTLSSAPLASTKLVDEVFRSLNIAGSGVRFGAHLSPFAIVCEGHEEHDSMSRLVKQAELAEAGSNMTLEDANRLIATDVRFPTTPQIAADKLYGWSIIADLFHGGNQPICNSIRNFALGVGPALHRIHAQFLDDPRAGMDLVCRVLFDAQQEYFVWANAVAIAAPGVGG